jgi:hypothetical protein
MRSLILSLTLFFLGITTHAINPDLKNRLDTIMLKDQGLRELLDDRISAERKVELLNALGLSKDDENNIISIMINQDKENLVLIREIIKEYGYPGKTLVGEPTNKAAWYVIQHSDAIEEFLPLIIKAGQEKEIPMSWVAIMEDRDLMQKGLEQKYGTQSYGQKIINEVTGEEEWFRFIWPIKDPENVEKLRKSIGLKGTVEEFATEIGIEYKVYTIDEINKIIK